MNTTTMTDPELNLTIAELIGVTPPLGFSKLREVVEIFKNRDDHGMAALTLAKIPNYAQDLNAMHEAEKMFLEGYHNVPEHADRFADAYAFELLKKVATWPIGFEWGSVCNEDYWKIAHATARQRAEAFIVALAK